jgi:non-ribosomal peptide synthase protein (TIGR01720 family)
VTDAARRGGGDPALPLAHLIEINALTLDEANGPRLTANWMWAGALLDEAAVRDLAETWFRALTALTRHARSRRRRMDAERSGAGRSDARRDRAAGG